MAQDYFGKPLSSTTIRSYIHKCQLKLYCAKGSPMLTVSRSAVDFSGLGGIWDGPSHSGNVHCGQMNQYFRYFLGGMDAVCSGPKKKRIIQTVTSNKSKSQGLSWYGVVSVPLAKVTCTSVMAPLMLKSTFGQDFGAQYAAFKKTSFPGTSMHISTRQCKTTFCTHYKVLAAEEEGTGTWLACLQSRPVSNRECVAHFEAQNATTKTPYCCPP